MLIIIRTKIAVKMGRSSDFCSWALALWMKFDQLSAPFTAEISPKCGVPKKPELFGCLFLILCSSFVEINGGTN